MILCGCRGTQGYAHAKCVKQWIRVSGRNECELCHQPWVKEIRVPMFREKHAPLALALGCIINLMFAYALWFETCLWTSEYTFFIIVLVSFVALFSNIYMWHVYFVPYKLKYLYLITWVVIFYGISGVLQGFCPRYDISLLYFPYIFSFVVHVLLFIKSHLSQRMREPQSSNNVEMTQP